MSTFQIERQVYHCIGSLLLEYGNPQFFQIYFISDVNQISLRQNIVPNLKKKLIEQLQNILNTQ